LEDVKGIVSGATPDETLTVENAVLLVDYVGRAGMADSLAVVNTLKRLDNSNLQVIEGALYGSDTHQGMLAVDRELHPETMAGNLTISENAVSRLYAGGIVSRQQCKWLWRSMKQVRGQALPPCHPCSER